LLCNRRSVLVFLAALPAAGCGFTPVYRQDGAAAGLQGQVRINVIEGRDGYDLVTALEAQLGAASPDARYALHINLDVSEESLILDVLKGITRYTLNGKVKLSLRALDSGKEVFTDKLRETVAYSGTAETAQTDAARRAAHKRLMQVLAERIALRLATTAQSWTS